MSSNLTARPTNPRGGLSLSTELKFALRKRLSEPVDNIIDFEIIPYLEGLCDAGVKDAGELVAYIEKHGEVSVKEEF